MSRPARRGVSSLVDVLATLARAGALVAAAASCARAVSAEEPPGGGDPSREVVVRLDDRGGYGSRRKTDEARLSIRADGRLRAPSLHGVGQDFEATLPAEDLRALLRFVVEDQRFFELDRGAIEADIAKRREPDDPVLSVADASETVVEIRWGGRAKTVSFPALGAAVAMHPDVDGVRRLASVVRRIDATHAAARAGGREGARRIVETANAALAKAHPGEAAFSADDLEFTGERPDGTRIFRMRRRTPPGKGQKVAGHVVAMVFVAKDGASEVFLDVGAPR
jgi:hypothetical protein